MSNDLRKFLRKEILREWYRIPITESETSEMDDDESGSVDEALRAISSDQIQAMMDTAALKNPRNGSEMTLDDARAHFLRLWDRYSNDDIRAVDDDGNDREAFEQDARMDQILKFASGRDEDERWKIGTVLSRDGSPAEAEEAPSIEPTPRGEDVLNYPGDSKYEYKMEDDTWYTRQQGSDRWISLAPDKFQGTRVKLDAEAADNDDWPERGDAVVSADSGSDGPGSTAADEEEQAPEGRRISFDGKSWEKYAGGVWKHDDEGGIRWDGEDYDSVMVQDDDPVMLTKDGRSRTVDQLGWTDSSPEDAADVTNVSYSDLEDEARTFTGPVPESITERWGRLAGLLQD